MNKDVDTGVVTPTAGQALAQQTGQNILQELEAFGLAILLGQPATVSYTIPTEKVTKTFSFLGRTYTFTAEESAGKLVLTETPS